jgi:NDP-sugar pyrophosphorylase family protein
MKINHLVQVAVKFVERENDSTFILSNCDILIDEDYEKILNYHKKKRFSHNGMLIKKIVIPYGVIDISNTGEIENMREKPELSFFTNTGHVFSRTSIIDDSNWQKYWVPRYN